MILSAVRAPLSGELSFEEFARRLRLIGVSGRGRREFWQLTLTVRTMLLRFCFVYFKKYYRLFSDSDYGGQRYRFVSLWTRMPLRIN